MKSSAFQRKESAAGPLASFAVLFNMEVCIGANGFLRNQVNDSGNVATLYDDRQTLPVSFETMQYRFAVQQNLPKSTRVDFPNLIKSALTEENVKPMFPASA